MTYTNILQQLQQYAKEHNVAIITATQLKIVLIGVQILKVKIQTLLLLIILILYI